MNVVRCKEGSHFYDRDKYGDDCPHCASGMEPKGVGSYSEQQPSQQPNPEPKPKPISIPRPEQQLKSESGANSKSLRNGVKRDGGAKKSDSLTKALNWFRKPKEQAKPLENESRKEEAGPETQNDASDKKEQERISEEPVSKKSQTQENSQRTLGQDIAGTGILTDDDIKTMGYFGGTSSDQPVVGWLVAISGKHYGMDYKLHAGKNFIGRHSGMHIVLEKDEQVHRDRHATIIYEPQERIFYLPSAECNGMVYVNNGFLKESRTLASGDRIRIGGTTLLFVPLCGEDFSWDEETEQPDQG